jgi:acetyl-CoA C-acetyltransferase
VKGARWPSATVRRDRGAIVGTLAKLLATRGSGRGLISVCTAGGMGVTAIMER